MNRPISYRPPVRRWPLVLLAGAVTLAGCNVSLPFRKRPPATPVLEVCTPDTPGCLAVQTPDENTVRPAHRPGTVPEAGGNTGANTGVITGAGAPNPLTAGQNADAFDTSTEAQKRAATRTDTPPDEQKLGKTVASLGAVAEPGFWLKTPLVLARTEGRVVWASNGNSVKLTLIPKPGTAGAGSQISLAAMRAMEIPLTALPELIVFAR